MPSPIRMIAIDIDGTLLPSTGTTMSLRNRRALHAATAAGIQVVIATGRRHAYALPIAQQAELRPESIMISSNGAVTRSFAGELLHRTLLDAGTARDLCGALRSFGETFVFTFDRVGPEGLVVENLGAVHRQIARWVEANRPYITEVTPLERAFEGGEAPIQGMLCGPVAQMRAAAAVLEASPLASRVALHRTEYPERELSILDLLPPGCSKGAALRYLAQTFEIEQDAVMAIGDNFNDLEMLEYSGHSVLMSNATAELRSVGEARGWKITGSNDEDGVAIVIEQVLASGNVTPAPEALRGEKTALATW